jgi:alcohol dehydrogenase
MAVKMKAWRLARVGGALELVEIDRPLPRPGTVLVRLSAVPLLGYFGEYLKGALAYWHPPAPFTPGTNGVGVVEAVGPEVYHLAPGQRVALSPHLLAREIVPEPAQILIGLTGVSPDSGPMLAAWPDGTLAEYALMPATCAVPLAGLDHLSDERLASLGKFIVPLGGLQRGRLSAGESLIVNGATGYFGSAAVLLGLALGAGRIVAAARDGKALAELGALSPRILPVTLAGDLESDVASLRRAAGGGAHLAFDIVGRAGDATSTMAALKALGRGGRLVLMGSMTVPLPINYGEVLINDWEIIGNFMYRASAYLGLVALLRAGLLDLGPVRIASFALADLPQAIEAAATMRGLACTVVRMNEG